jgi:hypothetical protein
MAYTKTDLLRGVELAILARDEGPQLDHTYDQSKWDCGTACCVHGFARLSAQDGRTDAEPRADDYRDVPFAREALFDTQSTPEMVAALACVDQAQPPADIAHALQALELSDAEVARALWKGTDMSAHEVERALQALELSDAEVARALREACVP